MQNKTRKIFLYFPKVRYTNGTKKIVKIEKYCVILIKLGSTQAKGVNTIDKLRQLIKKFAYFSLAMLLKLHNTRILHAISPAANIRAPWALYPESEYISYMSEAATVAMNDDITRPKTITTGNRQ